MKKETKNKIKIRKPEIITTCSVCKTVSPLCEWCGDSLKYYSDCDDNYCVEYKNKTFHFDDKSCLLNYLDEGAFELKDFVIKEVKKELRNDEK